MFSVAVSVLIMISALARLLLTVPVSPMVVVSASCLNDDFGAAGSVRFIVAAIAIIVNSDTRSLLLVLSASMTDGGRFFQNTKLFPEVGVCVRDFNLRRSPKTGISFEDLALLHVDGFRDAL